MPKPLVRSLYCWLISIIVVALNVCFFHGCSAFVPQSITTTKTTTQITNRSHHLLIVSLPFQRSIQVATAAAAAASPSSSSARKQNHHEKWQPYYDALTEYKKDHGHCEVTVDDNPSLSGWLEDQRKSYRQMKLGRKTKLTKKRAIALEMIGAIPAELLEL